MMNTELLDRAIIFAVKAHAGTERRGKDFPYIVHPMEAVAIAATLSSDQEILAAAALHDVVEDTSITAEDLEKEFGARVASLVVSESDEPGKSWRERKQAAIDRIAAEPLDAKIVALSDKLSNMRAIYRDYLVQGDSLWSIFHVKDRASHEWHYRGLLGAFSDLKDTEACKEFGELIEKVFVSKAELVDLSEYEESGAGYTAISYNHKDGKRMIKLYNPFILKEVPESELRIARAVFDMGIPSPKPLRMVTDGTKLGTEFQRITPKKSFARAMSDDPSLIEHLSREFARESRKLHSIPCRTDLFGSAKDFYQSALLRTKEFSDEEKAKISAFISSIPDAKTCLHGDCHIGNILISNGEYYWIDLSDFRWGAPEFDLSMMYLSTVIPEEMCQGMYHLTHSQCCVVWDYFCQEYFGGKRSRKSIEEEVLPYAALNMVAFSCRGPLNPFERQIVEKGILER